MPAYNQKVNKRWAFYVLYAALMALVFLGHALEVPVPEILLVGISALMVLSGDRDQVLAALVMCIPLCMVFSTIYVCLAGIITWAVRYKDRIRIDTTILPVLLMILWELIHCLFGGFSIKPFIGIWVPYLICLLVMWQDASELDYGFVTRCLAACISVMCLTLLGIVLKQSHFQISVAFTNMQRLGMATEGNNTDVLRINPNSLGVMCTIAVSGLLQLAITGQRRRMDMVWILIMLICGVLTTSRTFLLLLVTMVLLFWMNQEGGLAKKLRFLLKAAVIGVLALAVLYLIFPMAIDNFIARFAVSDLTSGRADLFRIYNRFLADNPRLLLFGVGLMGFDKKVVTEYAVASNMPHNGIQEILVAWGIPGLALFLWFLGTLIHRSGKGLRKRRLMSYIPLILLLLKVQFGQIITSTYTMMAFIYCYLSMSCDFEKGRTLPHGEQVSAKSR